MAGIFLGSKKFTTANNDDNWLQFDNIFSQKHSLYELHFYDIATTGTTAINYVEMSLIDNTGAVLSDSNYHWTRTYGRSNAAGRQTPISGLSQSKWQVAMSGFTDWPGNTVLTIHTPYESNRITSFMCSDIGSTTELHYNQYAGTYETNTSITGFRIFSSDTNEEMFIASVAVFGLGK